MKREEAQAILQREGLTRYNWYGDHPVAPGGRKHSGKKKEPDTVKIQQPKAAPPPARGMGQPVSGVPEHTAAFLASVLH